MTPAVTYQLDRALWAGPMAATLIAGDPGDGCVSDMRKLGIVQDKDALLRLEPLDREIPVHEIERAFREAEAMRDRALAAAELMLRLHWEAVERIAHAILKCDGAITGEVVATLVENTPPGSVRFESFEQLLELVRKARDPLTEAVHAVHAELDALEQTPTPALDPATLERFERLLVADREQHCRKLHALIYQPSGARPRSMGGRA